MSADLVKAANELTSSEGCPGTLGYELAEELMTKWEALVHVQAFGKNSGFLDHFTASNLGEEDDHLV